MVFCIGYSTSSSITIKRRKSFSTTKKKKKTRNRDKTTKMAFNLKKSPGRHYFGWTWTSDDRRRDTTYNIMSHVTMDLKQRDVKHVAWKPMLCYVGYVTDCLSHTADKKYLIGIILFLRCKTKSNSRNFSTTFTTTFIRPTRMIDGRKEIER